MGETDGQNSKQPASCFSCSLCQHFPEVSISTGLRELALGFGVKRPQVRGPGCSWVPPSA